MKDQTSIKLLLLVLVLFSIDTYELFIQVQHPRVVLRYLLPLFRLLLIPYQLMMNSN